VNTPRCCCCDSPAALLLSSVAQVEEVCDRSWVVPQLHRMASTVEQILYGVWCHSTLRTDIWYAVGNAGLVNVQKLTVTRTQLGEIGTDLLRQQTFKRWDIPVLTTARQAGMWFTYPIGMEGWVDVDRCVLLSSGDSVIQWSVSCNVRL